MRSLRLFPSARSRPFRGLLLSASVLGATAAVVIAEQQIVQRPSADVLDAKGSAGDVIETIPLNGSLEVLGREDPWVRVRTPSGKVGYVTSAVFTKSSGGTDLSNAFGKSSASRTEASAAGRGWDKEVETYVSSKNLNRVGLERMERARIEATGKPLKDFKKNGNLGGSN